MPVMDAGVNVSVIVCTHNRARYLQQCLSSIAAQKCSGPFEVIIIDNGSTDETAAVICEWCEKDSRFRSTREDRLGLSRAKNAGVRMARGDLLVFTDDDVIADSNWIDAYCRFFARKTNGMILGGGPIIPVPDDLGGWPEWFDQRALCNIGLLDYRGERPLERWECLWGANMAIPKRVFAKFGLWDETIGRRGNERGTFEDVEYQERIKNTGGSVWFCPGAVVHHRVDRRTITPRRVITAAFARGCNEFLQEGLRKWGTIDVTPQRNLITGLPALAGNLSLWALWMVAFRLFPGKSLFERVRHAAWSCGWWLSSLGAGRDSMRSQRMIARGAFFARGLVLRLALDTSRRD